jgi:hypothetical protein
MDAGDAEGALHQGDLLNRENDMLLDELQGMTGLNTRNFRRG